MDDVAVTALSGSILLTQAGVDSFSAKVPGSVPADKDASRVLLSKEFAFLSSLLVLLVAPKWLKNFLYLRDKAGKEGYIYMGVLPLKQWDCDCVLLKVLRSVRTKIKTIKYSLNVTPSLTSGCSPRSGRGTPQSPRPAPRHSSSSGRQRYNSELYNLL